MGSVTRAAQCFAALAVRVAVLGSSRYKKLVPFADAKPTEFLSHQFPVEICRKAGAMA